MTRVIVLLLISLCLHLGLVLGICGDGILEAQEECDDGNRTPLDGCDSNCELEFCSGIYACFDDYQTFIAEQASGNTCIDLETLCPNTTSCASLHVDCSLHKLHLYNNSQECRGTPSIITSLWDAYDGPIVEDQYAILYAISEFCDACLNSLQFFCQACPVCKDGIVQEYAGEECEPNSRKRNQDCSDNCTFLAAPVSPTPAIISVRIYVFVCMCYFLFFFLSRRLILQHTIFANDLETMLLVALEVTFFTDIVIAGLVSINLLVERHLARASSALLSPFARLSDECLARLEYALIVR